MYVFDDFFFLCSIKKVQLKILDLYLKKKKLSEFYNHVYGLTTEIKRICFVLIRVCYVNTTIAGRKH